MARCPDCGGEVKWKPPFYVCLDCGLSFRRGEFEEVKKTIKKEFKDQMGETEAETERKERQRKKDYHDWLMKKKEN